MAAAFVLLLLSQLAGDQEPSLADPWKSIPLKKVSEIDLPPDALEGEWKVSNGVRIDDLSKLQNVPAAQRQIVKALAKQLSPIGVRSAADYTLTKTGFPMNTVTVRLFVFEDAKQCKSWWKKKYEYDGWQKHYKKIDAKAAVVVNSLQVNKSAIGFGNVWLTTHQLQEGDQHIKAANHILKLLTDGKRSVATQ